MTINIICETAPGFSFHYKKLAKDVIVQSLDTEGFPYEAEVNLTLVDKDRIHEINREMRQIDRPTDVLSFPMIEYAEPADFDGVEHQFDDCVNPDTEEVLLGDIVISVEKATAQAELYGHSFQREMGFLTVHSMLHLLGYDHEAGGLEAAKMREKEEMILARLGLTRDTDDLEAVTGK